MGSDTHALSEPAFATALEVLAAERASTSAVDAGDGFTPTPAISHAILDLEPRPHPTGLADGIVVTPSHNPPEDGGFKYNPPNGGPADTDVTGGSRTRPIAAGRGLTGASAGAVRAGRRGRGSVTTS